MVIKKKGNKKAVYVVKILKKYIYKKSIFVKKLQITLHFSYLICLFKLFHKKYLQMSSKIYKYRPTCKENKK